MSQKTAGNYRVLIVDDDFRVGALHAEMVNAIAGFEALEPIQDPRVVPKAISSHKPDLVLLDLYLPHVSGLELLPALGVDAIMISAATEPENVSQAIARGALSFIIKPFDAKTLASKLRGWARYRRQLETAAQLDQQGVDRLYRTLQGAEESAASSSGAAPTEQAVLACVKAATGPLSVAEVAESVGVARATAQRYLAALVANDALELQLGYGTRGRPEHRYVAR
ncbi:transcriptional regulatory protein [Glutamicibacter uratoxydans]|uniref:Transcriptional regulatory protein n=1 Tax=Glutamicibacter uratoxydans TaxID=43667 RepID=A0A4Y4DWV5_GLUUR|nr:response regulator [Glutamicibacter uratoxydans]GED07900.1 transcriptional regulatory protein [Glutamicibacter uratoxydans]